MPISLTCQCGKSYRLKQELAGKRAKCLACGTVNRVPAQVDEAAKRIEEIPPAFEVVDQPLPEMPKSSQPISPAFEVVDEPVLEAPESDMSPPRMAQPIPLGSEPPPERPLPRRRRKRRNISVSRRYNEGAEGLKRLAIIVFGVGLLAFGVYYFLADHSTEGTRRYSKAAVIAVTGAGMALRALFADDEA